MMMKKKCAILVILICCSDLISARRRKIPQFCKNGYKLPEKPMRNSLERISQWQCNLYTWAKDQLKYIEKWGMICENDVGIINGTNANEGEFPHMGALGWEENGEITFKCGAFLISPKFALTAAHCSYDRLHVKPTIVRFGTTNIKKPSEEYVDARIKQIIRHPRYSSPLKYYDIALCELTEDLSFSLFINPACLGNVIVSPKYQQNITVTGWGVTSVYGNTINDKLLKAHLSVVDDDLCKSLSTNLLSSRHWKDGLKGHQFCAAKLEGGTDTCWGDSGGPIQISIQSLANDRKIHYAFGITSTGVSCGVQNQPGIYTRIYSFIDWIEEIVWPEEYQSN